MRIDSAAIIILLGVVALAVASDNPVNDLHGGTSVGTTTSTQQGNEPTDVNGSKDPKAQGGDPIDTVTGQYLYQCEDVLIQGVINLPVTRLYRSGSRYQGMFGLGWNLLYNERLMLMANGNVLIRSGNSDRDEFTPQGNNTYESAPGSYLTLAQKSDGSFTLRNKYGLIKIFNKEGCLTEYRDSNGNQIMFSYDPGGKLPINAITEFAQATNAILVAREYRLTRMEPAHNGQLSGRFVTFSYDANGRVTAVADFTGRKWTYAYDTAGYGELLSVTAPPASDNAQPDVQKYTYTPDHRLATVAEPGEKPSIANRYDAEGRVMGQQWGDVSYGFSYPSSTLRIETNSTGSVVERTLDKNNQIIAMKHQSGRITGGTQSVDVIKYQYDANGQQTVTSNSGSLRQVMSTYDERGNETGMSNGPKNQCGTVSFASGDCKVTYEPKFNMPKTFSDGLSNVVTCTYDYENPASRSTNGNIVGITLPTIAGATSSIAYTYNVFGQIASITTPNGCLTRIDYDKDSGQIINVTIAEGNPSESKYTFTRDKFGNMLSRTDPMGNTSRYDYDVRNRVIRETQPAGSVIESVYAGEKLVQVRKTADGNVQTMELRHDARGLVSEIKNETGSILKIDYDENANITHITDPLLNCVSYTYGDNGLLYCSSDAYSNASEFAYSPDGDMTSIQDANGNITKRSYDATGRYMGSLYPDGTSESVSHDYANYSTKLIARDGGTIEYTWDTLGQIKTKKLADGSLCRYAYDASGQLTGISEAGHTIAYGYDMLGRISSEGNAYGGEVRYAYNKNGLITSITHPNNTVITFEYDAGDRPKSVAMGGKNVASYSYDKITRQTAMKCGNGVMLTKIYDSRDKPRVVAWAGASGMSLYQTELSYDKMGNVIKAVESGQLGKGTYSYAYDKVYRLVSEIYPTSYPFTSKSITYDAMGNRISMRGADDVNYTINALNQYAKVGSTAFVYDKNGNVTYAGSCQFSYNAENQLIGIQPLTGSRITYNYDSFDRRIEEKAGNHVIRFVYAGPHVIADVDEKGKTLKTYIYGAGIDEIIAMVDISNLETYYYVKNFMGFIVALTDSQGAIVESYVYDAWGNVKAFDENGDSIRESAVGNRFLFQGREYCWSAGIYYFRSRWYSPDIGRWLSVDDIGIAGGINLYSFCCNNPINYRDPFGLATYIVTYGSDVPGCQIMWLEHLISKMSVFNSSKDHIIVKPIYRVGKLADLLAKYNDKALWVHIGHGGPGYLFLDNRPGQTSPDTNLSGDVDPHGKFKSCGLNNLPKCGFLPNAIIMFVTCRSGVNYGSSSIAQSAANYFNRETIGSGSGVSWDCTGPIIRNIHRFWDWKSNMGGGSWEWFSPMP